MDDNQWTEVIGRIKDTFTVESEGDEPLEGHPGTRSFIVFEGPLGRMKLERTVHPVITGEKGMGAKRIGASHAIAYEYGNDDVQRVTAYLWKDTQWVTVDAGALTQ